MPSISLSGDYTVGGSTLGDLGYDTGTGRFWLTSLAGEGAIRTLLNPDVADGTTISNTAEQAFYATAVPMPVNSLKAGTVVKGTMWGVITTAAVPTATLTLRLKIGATTILTVISTALLGGLAASGWVLDYVITVEDAGHVRCYLRMTLESAAGVCSSYQKSDHLVAVDLTAQATIVVTGQLSSTDTGANSIVAYGRCVEA